MIPEYSRIGFIYIYSNWGTVTKVWAKYETLPPPKKKFLPKIFEIHVSYVNKNLSSNANKHTSQSVLVNTKYYVQPLS